MGSQQTSSTPRVSKSFRKQARRAYVRSLEGMRKFFRQCDAARAERVAKGDKGVYEEL